MNVDDVLTAIRRSDRALAEQLGEWESLPFGVAYTSTEFADLPEANQLRDVWLADVDGPTTFDRAEAYFAERSLTCLAWSPAAGQAVDEIDRLLAGRGWRRFDRLAMGWRDMGRLSTAEDLGKLPPVKGLGGRVTFLAEGSPVDASAAGGGRAPLISVLPARAMRRAFARTFAIVGAHREGEAPAEPIQPRSHAAPDVSLQAATRRLDDPNYDAFVALVDGQPAGRVGYLQVGDVARITDLLVLDAFRRRGAARALLAHVLHLARRLLPKAVVCAVPTDNAPARRLFESCGFEAVGKVSEFHRASSLPTEHRAQAR